MIEREAALVEEEVRTLIETWVRAVNAADASGASAGRAPDIVMFDVPSPENGIRGLDEHKSAWQQFRQFTLSGGRFELVELHVEACSDLAWAWALLRCGTDADLAAAPERRLRISFGLRGGAGQWEVAHEHHSFTLS